MDDNSFHGLDDKYKKLMLEGALGNEGDIISIASGMCGDVYIFDRGPSTHPRYSCAKIPKLLKGTTEQEVNKRFVNELRNQLKYYHHQYVHWAYDFKEVMGVPVALFRYWGSDLKKIINEQDTSLVNKISIMVYLSVGLRHCYNNGLVSHQDLKPANIFIRNLRNDLRGLPEQDIYDFPLVGDFGLANASIESEFFEGARPYMAPEQWNKETLSSKTDVFALGIILFELMSCGYHPVGIKLCDYWPVPLPDNSKKWTKADHWRKWSISGSSINEEVESLIDVNVLGLIKKMISLSPHERPQISEVIETLLQILKDFDKSSYSQVQFLINHYDEQVSTESLEVKWPSLFHRWKRFEEKFG